MRHIRADELHAGPLVKEVLARFCRDARQLAPDQVRQIIVYGSIARGDAGPDSDLDIWVDWEGPEPEGRDALMDLAARLFVETGVLVSVHVVDADHRERLRAMDAMFYRNVQREGVVVEG